MSEVRHDLALPASAERHPTRLLLHRLRAPARAVVRRRFEVRVHDAERVPTSGPVILASNHVGIADGPLLAVFSPRPVHALTKQEMFAGRMGRFLHASGQIPLDRYNSDPAAVKSCLRVLRDRGVVGIFPEGARGSGELHRFHRGAAYLALVSGAPVVPVMQFGTREPGATSGSLPVKGGVVDILFGPTFTVEAQPWPRTKQRVNEVSHDLRTHMREYLEVAKQQTGRTLPGPIPGGGDADPDTGITP